ncbi:MAG: choice-of-anchor D domain-containing protein [Pseudomonadota bacterium]
MTRRSLTLLWTVALAGLSFARCDCEDPNLAKIPKPEIQVIDVETGRINDQAVAESGAFVVDFGAVDIGQQAIRTLRVLNSGTGQLHVTAFRLVEEGLDETLCDGLKRGFGFVAQDERATPMNIDPTKSRDVRISFTPPAAGPHCLGLLIQSDDENEKEVLVYLTGQGSGGRLCTTPYGVTRLDFGPVFVGESSTETLQFENCGNRAISLTGISIDTNPDDVFALVTLPTLPLSMEPGASFSMDLSFSPEMVREYRASLAGLLKLVTGAPYPSEQFVALEGTGAERPRCKITSVPLTVNFGAVAGNAGQVDRTLLLKNNGECHCEISALSDVVMDAQASVDAGTFSLVNSPALPFFLQGTDPTADGCSSTGNPTSSTQQLTVRYTLPNRTTAAVERGHFDVTSTDPVNSPLTVFIEANGGGVPHCQVKISPEAPDQVQPGGGMFEFVTKTLLNRWGLVRFGNVNLHFERFQPITVENIGNYDCVVKEIKWRQSWTTTNEFGFADENQQRMTLPAQVNRRLTPGQIATWYAVFKPTHAYSSTLPIPDMRCLSGGYCAALTSSMQSETCFTQPCQWGNGVDIVTGDGSDPLTQDTVTDQSALTLHTPGTFSVGFMGKPTTPAIDVIPAEIDFGMITVGCGSEERTIKVYNTGNGDLVITRLEISPTANPDEFRITAALVPPNYTLQPGGTPMPINVRFLPRREGVHRADLIIYALEGTTEVPMFTVPLQGEGTLETHQTDVFRQLFDPLVDVLWVVDDSGSMSTEQDILGQNFPSFFTQTSINNVDYHIAVTTTLTRDTCVPDFTNPNDSCAGTPPHPKAGFYTSCNGNDKWITTATSNPEQQFSCNVKVSDSGNVNPDRPTSDSAEGGLMAARLFLSPPNIDDANANLNFLRDDAKLYVIMVSDEEDQSDGPTDLYVDFFRNLKGFRNAGLINVSAIAGDVPGGCGDTSGQGSGAGAEAGARYKDVVDAMGGLFHSICSSDWSSMLSSLAFDSFGLKIQFFLTRGAASAADIEVCVSSQDLTGHTGACSARGGTVVALTSEGAANGWWYDAGSNSVVFNAGSVPPRGQWIRVDYDTACLPLQP